MLSSREAYRLLDVGGTAIKCADGRSIPSRSGGTGEQIAQALRLAVGETAALRGLGVAIPGPFDYQEGIFRMDHKFAAVKGISFRTLAGIPDVIPVRFLHDVNAPLAGAIRMLHLEQGNTALVTLGTGLGFSYALRGEVQCSSEGSPARSLWNAPAEDGGILEDRISARGIKAAYLLKTGDDSPSVADIARLAYAGDAAAIEVFAHLGDYLGKALQGIFQEMGIDSLLMGGQISKSLSLMLEPLQRRLDGVRILPVPEGAVFEGLSTLFE